jgi:hypothetical protein
MIITHLGGYDVYYCHWCADFIAQIMFWGPEYGLSVRVRLWTSTRHLGGGGEPGLTAGVLRAYT